VIEGLVWILVGRVLALLFRSTLLASGLEFFSTFVGANQQLKSMLNTVGLLYLQPALHLSFMYMHFLWGLW